MKKIQKGLYLTMVCLLLTISSSIYATNYYVSSAGNNSNNGTSRNTPWQTMSKVNSSMALFNPGDSILFSRNDYFYGGLSVTRSGNSSANIVFGNYGTGNLPKWQYSLTGASTTALVRINNGSYITFDGFKITDTTMAPGGTRVPLAHISYAFLIDGTSHHCTIKNSDISLVGAGVQFQGGNNHKFLNNYVYNLREIYSTTTAVNADDDYGANGVILSSSSDDSILNNTFEGNWAFTYDYGNDGGAVEYFGPCSRNIVMYNKMIDCGGAFEFGSFSAGICSDNLVAYNLIVDCGATSWCNISGKFAIEVSNIMVYNNIIVSSPADRFAAVAAYPIPLFAYSAGSASATIYNFKNNIFYLNNSRIILSSANTAVDKSKFAHSNNIYRLFYGTAQFGANYTPTASELNTTANLFTSTTGDASVWNYYPLSTSPAVNFGSSVGLTKDFVGNPISGKPEAGDLELTSITPPPPVVVINVTATSSAIACNGGMSTITVSASGGTTPYSGTGSFVVAAGSYSYTVTDANGAKGSVSISVTQPTIITEALTALPINYNGGTTSLSVVASGGTGTYTYSLNNGAYQTATTFANLLAGNYTVTVKDANGCTSAKSISITQPQVLIATAAATKISCNGSSAIITVSATGGTAPFTGTGTFTVLAGTYNYTVTDANGIKSSVAITVTQPNPIVETLSALPINTYGGTSIITTIASGGTSPYTYSLNNGIFQSINTFSNIVAGSYSVTVKDLNGCTAVKNITITQPNVLVANASASTIACNGGSAIITVTATGGTAPYTGTGTFSVLAGTYSYTVTDVVGLKNSVTITVNQPEILAETLSAPDILTFGGTTTITVNATGGSTPYSYNLNGGAFQTVNTFPNVLAGNYTIGVKDARGCATEKTISITQPLGSHDTQNGFNINVYPNPTRNYFVLDISKYHGVLPIEITVFNEQGNMVYKIQGSADRMYKFGYNFTAGIYIVKVNIGLYTQSIKAIKL